MTQLHTNRIAQSLSIPAQKVRNTLALLDEGATIPFIARYRKEQTGSLDEVAISSIQQQLKKLTELEKRRESILHSIEEQGKLSDELRRKIEQTYDATTLEDLYLPYKRKRKTRASAARERGLEPLAKKLMAQQHGSVRQWASAYLNEEVGDEDAALQGARDIIAEWINEGEKVRERMRRLFERDANIRSRVVRSKETEAAKYRDYFDFEESLRKCPSHRLLAIRRGEDEGFLRVSIAPDEGEALYQIERLYIKGRGEASEELRVAVKDAYKRLLGPSIETEFRNKAKEKADAEAIRVFAENLRQLLLAAPLGQKRVLALDPGFRTGCKLVCLDESGNLLYNSTVYPHPPQSQSRQTTESIRSLIHRFQIDAIAIGNGTAGRETMTLLRSADLGTTLPLFMVNESGASIYSASEIARDEFPDLDLTVRGAISIGRRLVDPLAELVKIDPKSIGVGQYQHDVNQPMLKESLDRVVESCVNSVGINLNTASKHLLTYVSGLGPSLAQNIVDFRRDNGQFQSRNELKKVPRMGDKSFEQCAGFLRVREAANPLDNTAVHPERYALVRQMAKDLSCSVQELIQQKELQKRIELQRYVGDDIGLPSLKDILDELRKPGLDPRGEAQSFEFDKNVSTIEDLREGMILPGIVTNITNFGAFVDVGVKQDGLVHVSQLANKYVKDPLEIVSLQQQVRVRVTSVDVERKRVGLSMRDV
ncbi:MAG: Tex family protein [Bacteroidota bacterium]